MDSLAPLLRGEGRGEGWCRKFNSVEYAETPLTRIASQSDLSPQERGEVKSSGRVDADADRAGHAGAAETARTRRAIAVSAAPACPARSASASTRPEDFTSPRSCGERSDCEAIRVRGVSAYSTELNLRHHPSPRPSPRKSGARESIYHLL